MEVASGVRKVVRIFCCVLLLLIIVCVCLLPSCHKLERISILLLFPGVHILLRTFFFYLNTDDVSGSEAQYVN